MPTISRHMLSKRMYPVKVPYIMYMWTSHMRRVTLMVCSKASSTAMFETESRSIFLSSS